MWDERYSLPGHTYGASPNDFVASVADQLAGPVLCLAEGEGRNAIHLATLGLEVHTVDSSAVGVRHTLERAEAEGVVVHAVCADLGDYDLGEARWGSIVATFAHFPPPLRVQVHRAVVRALRPGGQFVLEAYSPDQLAAPGIGGPPVPELLYTPEMLAQDLEGLDVQVQALRRVLDEGPYHQGESGVVQVRATRPE